MIYLEHNYLFSIVLSLLMVNGFYNLAFKFRWLTNSFFFIKNVFFSTIINFFIIINLLGLFSYNFFLFNEINNNIIKLISLSIIAFGLYKPSYLKLKIFKKNDYKLNLIYLILFFYFILSLNPITDSDSLDYHLTIPLYQIEFGNSQFYKYWLHSQLAGAGESLYLYSLVLGAIHFSQILQFVSLLLIVLIFLNFSFEKIKIDYHNRLFVCLSLITMPVFLFLVATSKPQLFPLTTNFISLVIATFYLPKLKGNNLLVCFFLLVFLLLSSTQIKFSFLLSSGLILLYSIYQIINKKILLKLLIVIAVLSSAIVLPREIFEFINFNNDIFYNFFNPVTDKFGADTMNESLRHGSGNSRYLIFWLFFPYDQYGQLRLGEITYCIGPFALYCFFNYNFNFSFLKNITIVFIIYFIFAMILAQPTGRFYIEIFTWLLFFSLFYKKETIGMFQKIFRKFLLLFSLFFLLFLGYFSLNLFIGNINKNYLDNVLSTNADGFLLYKWANEVIPSKSIIISTHRASAFYKHEVVSYEFRLFDDFSKGGYEYYLKHIMKKNPKYILYTSKDLNNKKDILKNCRGELFKFKKNVGYDVGRNPFNKNKNYYDGYIYKISPKDIKNCTK